MKAVLLAAGKGKRLRPATEARPKPLLPIAGSTLFEYNLSVISDFPNVYVVVSYGKELFQELADGYGFTPVDQGEPMGTGHAVLKLGEVTRDDLLLIYSDIYLPPGTREKILSYTDRYDHVVAVTPVDRPWEFGVVELEDGLLKRIVEKPPKGEEPSNLIIAGAFFLSQTIFDHVREVGPSPRGEIELTDALTRAAKEGERIGVVEISPWVDAGRPDDFLRAQKLLLDDVIEGKRSPPKGYRIEGDLLISGDVDLSNSEVSGPSALGECLLAKSKVGPYSYLEHHSEITHCVVSNSIIMRRSKLSFSSIESSLITDGSVIITSDLRRVITAPSVRVEGCSLSEEKLWENKFCPT